MLKPGDVVPGYVGGAFYPDGNIRPFDLTATATRLRTAIRSTRMRAAPGLNPSDRNHARADGNAAVCKVTLMISTAASMGLPGPGVRDLSLPARLNPN